MQRCPRCGTARRAGEASCPTCSTLPTTSFELELDVEAVAPRGKSPPQPSQAHGAATDGPTRDGGGLGFDGLEAGGLLDVGLEDEPPSWRNAPPSSRQAQSSGHAAGPSSSRLSGQASDRRAEAVPAAASKEPNEAEVALVAGFGDPPFSWLPSVGYVIRVLRRRRVLEAIVVQVRAEADRKRRAAQSDMGSLLEAIEARVGEDEEVAALLRPLRDLSGQVQTTSEALARSREQHRADDAALAAELRAAEAAREQLTPERRTAQVWVEDATAAITRLKGELTRLSRDLTMAHEDAAKAAGDSEFAPPEHARQITELESMRARTTEEVCEAERNLAARRSTLADVDRTIAKSERAIADVHARRDALVRRARAEEQTGAEAVQSADHARLDATELVLRSLADDEIPRLTIDEVTRFEALDATLSSAARRRLLHERALVAHDPEAYRRGVILIAGGAAALVALVVLVVRLL